MWPGVVSAVHGLVHGHRPDPDLSAFVAFPACRCGLLLWPDGEPQSSAADSTPAGTPQEESKSSHQPRQVDHRREVG
jgi:hypothetical protein